MIPRRPKGARTTAVMQYIDKFPGCNTREISEAVGLDTTKVATVIWAELRRKDAVIERHQLRGGIYVYTSAGVPLPQPVAEPVAEPLPQPVAEPVAEPVPTTKPLDEVADDLARAIATIVSARVMQHLTEQLGLLLPSTLPELEPVTLEQLTARLLQKVVKPKAQPTVLIAGLLPNQAGIIQTEFGDVFDLRFFETNDNLQHLKAMVKNVDYAFTFTSKISHGVQEVIKSTGKPIFHCSGGMTMLKDLLLKLYAEGTL